MVIDEDIQLAKGPYRLLYGLEAVLLVPQISFDPQAAAAQLFNAPLCDFGIRGFVQIGNGYIRPFSGKCDRRRLADAAVSSGNQRHLAFELSAAEALRIFTDRTGFIRLSSPGWRFWC